MKTYTGDNSGAGKSRFVGQCLNRKIRQSQQLPGGMIKGGTVRIAFEKWPVSGQRVWTFTNHTGQLFLMAPFGPLTSWRVYGWPGELDEEGFEFPSRRKAVNFVLTLLKGR